MKGDFAEFVDKVGNLFAEKRYILKVKDRFQIYEFADSSIFAPHSRSLSPFLPSIDVPWSTTIPDCDAEPLDCSIHEENQGKKSKVPAAGPELEWKWLSLGSDNHTSSLDWAECRF